MFENIQAKDVMEGEVICVRHNQTLAEVREVLVHSKITGAPVLSEDDQLCGVISLSDLIQIEQESNAGEPSVHSYFIDSPEFPGLQLAAPLDEMKGMMVRDAMTREVFTVTPTDGISFLAATMRQNRIHRVIVAEEGKVAGIVTSMDLLKVLEGH